MKISPAWSYLYMVWVTKPMNEFNRTKVNFYIIRLIIGSLEKKGKDRVNWVKGDNSMVKLCNCIFSGELIVTYTYVYFQWYLNITMYCKVTAIKEQEIMALWLHSSTKYLDFCAHLKQFLGASFFWDLNNAPRLFQGVNLCSNLNRENLLFNKEHMP